MPIVHTVQLAVSAIRWLASCVAALQDRVSPDPDVYVMDKYLNIHIGPLLDICQAAGDRSGLLATARCPG